MNRRALIAGMAAAMMTPCVAKSEQPAKIARIGFLATTPPTDSPYVARLWTAFFQGLRVHGLIDGRNVVIEPRFSERRTERFPGLAAELVRLEVDVIVAASPPAIRAAMDATSTIPIVLIGTGYPVQLGFVASLARPGGNVTGVAYFPGGEGWPGKRLEVLKEAIPGLSQVAVLTNPSNQGHPPALVELRGAADTLKVKLQIVEARRPEDLDSAFAAAVRERAGAIVEFPDPMFSQQRRRIVNLATDGRLPALYASRESVAAGGLMSWGVDWGDQFRRLGSYIDKILKGVKPADLPVEQASKWELVINLRAARALGITVAPSVLLRADEIIE